MGVNPWVPSQSGGGSWRGSAPGRHHNWEEGGGKPLGTVNEGRSQGRGQVLGIVSPQAPSMVSLSQ